VSIISIDEALEVEDSPMFKHPGTLVTPYVEPENVDEHRTHIVNPPNNLHIWQPGMTAQDVVNIARLNGLPVVALCGYTWVPVHNPEKFDACESCIQIAGELMRGAGE
jgi:Protein of unknown function (DUF3039)